MATGIMPLSHHRLDASGVKHHKRSRGTTSVVLRQSHDTPRTIHLRQSQSRITIHVRKPRHTKRSIMPGLHAKETFLSEQERETKPNLSAGSSEETHIASPIQDDVTIHSPGEEDEASPEYLLEYPGFMSTQKLANRPPKLVKCTVDLAAECETNNFHRRMDQRICDILASCKCLPDERGLFYIYDEPEITLYAIFLTREEVGRWKEYHDAISKIVTETFGVPVWYFCR